MRAQQEQTQRHSPDRCAAAQPSIGSSVAAASQYRHSSRSAGGLLGWFMASWKLARPHDPGVASRSPADLLGPA